jgi:16S rRNA processing protein RimM
MEHLVVGRIVGTHGIRGEVKVLPNTDFPERRFAPETRLYLQHAGQSAPIPVVVAKGRPHKKVYLLQFVGCERIEDVQQWRDAQVLVPLAEAALDELDEDEYYFHQIIGCRVQTTEGRSVGEIKEILPLPANDVWVVKPDGGGKDILLPVVREFIKEIDLDERLITIAWMEGLAP